MIRLETCYSRADNTESIQSFYQRAPPPQQNRQSCCTDGHEAIRILRAQPFPACASARLMRSSAAFPRS